MPTHGMTIFGIFEGGGAKGIAHIGALLAAEHLGLRFAGVAGASAGAIAATLIATGHSARDIFDPDSRDRNILARHSTSIISLLGEKNWRQFQKIRSVTTTVLDHHDLSTLIKTAFRHPRSTRRIINILFDHHGHFSMETIAAFVNSILVARLREIYVSCNRNYRTVPSIIRFGDIDSGQFPEHIMPLKIAVTNLSTNALEIFSSKRTPRAVVGEVVAASAAVPYVFRPMRLLRSERQGDELFVDGGVVCNLPFWVFADEQLAYERIDRHPVPIAFTLVDRSAERPPKYMEAVARTAVFGSQSVAKMLGTGFLTVELEPGIGLLEFDANWSKMCGVIRDSYLDAEHQLRTMLVRVPTEINSALDAIVNRVQIYINGKGATSVHLRSHITEPLSDSSTLRVTHTYNMAHDTDTSLVCPGATEAFERKDMVVHRFSEADVAAAQPKMTIQERALLRHTLKSAVYVPIFEQYAVWNDVASSRPNPIGIFCLDSDDDLNEYMIDHILVNILAEMTITKLTPPLKLLHADMNMLSLAAEPEETEEWTSEVVPYT